MARPRSLDPPESIALPPPAPTLLGDDAGAGEASSDESLLAAYIDHRDRHSFAILVKRYQRELYSFLRRYLGDAEMAEDAFQGTFLQVHSKCHLFESGRRFRPWLYAIATNQAIDVRRRNKRHRMLSLDQTNPTSGERAGWLDELTDAGVGPDQAAGRQEDSRWLHDAIDELSGMSRDVVDLVYFQGLKYREAADRLGVPVGTVKSRLHAAIQRLLERWRQTHV
jgi:RNA polymerase sigma-70 factor, ECF subfamily